MYCIFTQIERNCNGTCSACPYGFEFIPKNSTKNEKLQKWYYILGIIQRISMVVITFLIMGVAYKAISIMLDFHKEILDIHILLNSLYNLIDKSWLF